MRLFVCEAICCGWAGELADTSLRAEGAAMLGAAVDDFRLLPGCAVVTLWDQRLGRCPIEGAEIVSVSHTDEAPRLFRRYAAECDATFDIAPELDGILLQRRQIIEEVGGVSLGSSATAIALCGDKYRLAGHLTSHGIPTIPTQLFESESTAELKSMLLVVKRRDGAGGVSMQLVRDPSDLDRLRRSHIERDTGQQMIVQPFIEGTHLSVSAIIGKDRTTIDIFPVGEQRLSDDGTFRYLGGGIPAEPAVQDSARELVKKTVAVVSGLAGYAGFDIVVPAGAPTEPLLVEINPRLTTSYLGYRALAEENLAERILFPERSRSPIRWKRGRVEFMPDGKVRRFAE